MTRRSRRAGTSWSCGAILAAIALASGLVSGASAAEFVPLYHIETRVEGEVGSDPPRVKLRLESPERAIQRSESVQVEDGWLVVDLARETSASDEPTEPHLAATFLVDFDEAPIQGLLRGEPDGAAAKAEQLIQALLVLTDQSIPIKSSKRGWDAASVVVNRGEGDCTEHAVLLAALARGHGLPARVVIGSLVEVVGDQVAAYGHAWTEIYDGKVWQRADAAQYLDPDSELAAQAKEMGQRLYYVPLSVVQSEGPGYVLELLDRLARTHPESVTVAWED